MNKEIKEWLENFLDLTKKINSCLAQEEVEIYLPKLRELIIARQQAINSFIEGTNDSIGIYQKQEIELWEEIKFLEAENQEKLKAHLSRLREEITNISSYKNICKSYYSPVETKSLFLDRYD
ncbi:MAG: hypothetical protein STSR0004_07520 [Peptococcaceae bacterium]